MNTAFDIDLQFGQEGEKWLTLLADEVKLEVKRDRKWHETGNIFIEFKYNGNDSGLAITKADFFACILTKDGQQKAVYIWVTAALKRALRKLYDQKKVKIIDGGDGDKSRGFLLPVKLIGELTTLLKE